MCADCLRPQLLPVNKRAVDAYLLCSTQWNHSPQGHPIGLRYADCLAMLRAHRVSLRVKRIGPLFLKVQTIEAAIVAAVREQAPPPTDD